MTTRSQESQSGHSMGGQIPTFGLEIVRHSNGRLASLKVQVGRSFGALVVSLIALWRGGDLLAVLKACIHW
jgi:hypothetical protein